ncbi:MULTISPECIES: hypothetical protein [unclassified Gilliamella]|uniref:hypothetical protein n=1 Tax=unclassified Gilliamella TaxID=2685620 RepID=UPI002269C510|nr:MULTISPECIES: hypothetical protein [unclassified Gilliamella]MCX8574186.1 hypothetical protein [Gilliamella sp. B3831]MCX8576417.1 hypothetical protein [Gilliamella sp. B3815]MCX8577858.1 hypothetical protein [Gilliamella sp. B2717]MCX8587730.1 hypothetical protein [Gilliamella sp. B3801]MCX8590918.1 hypothetical protein [Gilliamella sp. B3812]
MKKIVVIITLCLSVVLTGCQSSGWRTKDVDPALTNSNTSQFFSKSAWQSCVVGAGFSGLSCILVGGKPGVCLATAAVGCGVLMGANYYLDSKRAEYADEEMRIDAYIYDIQQNNMEVQAVTQNAQAVLDKNLATLKVLNSQIENKTLSKRQIKNELKQIDANIAYLTDKLDRMKGIESDWVMLSAREKQSGINMSKLDKQINQLHKQIALLEKQINVVSQQRSAVQVS